MIGETMKRLATDGTIRDGLGQAFEKGFDVPDQFVKDFNKLTYTAYKDTDDESADYVDEGHFARDLRAVKVPKLVIFGKDDRLVKPAAAETYHREFGLPVRLVAGAGHSPMVEQPAETARLLLPSSASVRASRSRPSSLGDPRPVHDVPPGVDVVRALVLVLQVGGSTRGRASGAQNFLNINTHALPGGDSTRSSGQEDPR